MTPGRKGDAGGGGAGLNLDLTVPDTARMMDFWLGGSHHFEVDRAMADNIIRLTPKAPSWIKAQRQFLQRVCRHLFDVCRLRNFLVAGSGLPTCGNVHEVVPDAKVIYTDKNPVTVAFGRNILGSNPNVCYQRKDAQSLHTMSGKELALFEGSGPIAFILVGLTYFFKDELLVQILSTLYDWAPGGSHLALTSLNIDGGRFAAASVAAYARMGSPLHLRSREDTISLLDPWQVTREGVRAASHWGSDEATEPAPPVFIHGCIAHKHA